MTNYVEFFNFVKEHPDSPCIVRAEDLDRFSRELVKGVREELEMQLARKMADREEEFILPNVVESTYHISRTTLYRLAKAGILVPVWVGGQRRYRRRDVEAYINK